ncbi:Ig-like domain-containing protein [Singulisphaera sp. Ch08]|uniref:Ig-like domain-containing protein n=1 Tax=Singulisphaera sp. Ch08 TaxID=3120278 RepID=A0AAU7CSA9_9BACT
MRLPKLPSARSPRRPARRRFVHFLLEPLEDRLQLSLMAAGSEFQVNTVVANEQKTPAVAMDPNGDFVVAWQGGTAYSGPAPFDIYIQRYNSAGTPQGGEVRVNTTTADVQVNPAVAIDASGDFVVTWESYNGASGYDIFAQRFNAAGAAQGVEFRVNSTTANDQTNSAVAMNANGDFVVTWVNGSGASADVFFQRYNASGVPQGSETVVNTTTTGAQISPSVGMDSAANFVIVWQDSSGRDGNLNGVVGRRFDASGAAITAEFVVNSTTTGSQDFPSIAMTASGNFFVTWRADGVGGNDIFARGFNASAVAIGNDFRVNTTTANAQILPSVAIDSQGNALVVWQSALGQDGSGDGVYAQQFGPTGTPSGSEFRVNSTVASNQNQPAVALSGTGHAVVVWQDQSREGAGNGYGIYAQRYQPVNVAPTLASLSNVSFPENSAAQTVNLSGISAGPGETQALTITATSSNPGLIPNPTVTYTSPNATGSLSFTPAANQSGTATITVTVTDDGGTVNGGVNTFTRTFTVTITAANRAPTLDAITDPAPIFEDAGAQTINLSGITAGVSESQALTITATSSNPGLIPNPTVTYTSPNATGSLSYTPVANASGTATITVTVTDDGGTANGGINTITRTFTVTVNAVNEAPKLDPISDPAAILEDAGTQTINLTGISAGASELQALTITATSSNPSLIPNPTVTYTSPNATGSLSYTPAANASGTATITVTVTDNGGTANGGLNTVTRTFTVTVTAVNDAPTLDPIADPAAILEDAGAQTINLSGITAGAGESQTLTITATSSNPGLIPDPTVNYTSPNATGSLSYTPVANASGTATITVTVTDDGGTANGGINTFTRTFTVTVTAVNDAPTLDPISDPAAIFEDSGTQTIDLSGISAGASESQALTITATSSNPGLISDPTVSYTSPNATGSLSYTPVANVSGTATITVTVTDNGGTANGGLNTVTRTFTVTVTAVNDAPTLDPISDPAAILEDAGTQTINLTGISAGPGESQKLTVTVASSDSSLIPNPTVTFATPDATGSLSYSPLGNQSGTVVITVTVTDDGGTAGGGVESFIRTFTVLVTAVNDAPTLDPISDPAPILEDAGAQTIHLSGITAGPNESQALTITATSSNPGLIADPTVSYTSPNATGSLSYTPSANASGTATITITVTDNGGTANGGINTFTRTFTVTVSAVNDAPTLDPISDPAPILEDAGAQTIHLTGITAGPSESQTLTITATSSNPGLILNPTVSYTSPNATGSLSYTPVANASGTAIITVTVTDDGGTADGGHSVTTRTFTVVVNAVNDAPSFTGGSDQTVYAGSGPQTVLGWATNLRTGPLDEAGQRLDFLVTNDNPGLFAVAPSIAPDGGLTFTPGNDVSGTATVTVRIHDDGGTASGGVDTSAVLTFTVTVVPRPVVLSGNLSFESDTGTSHSDGITNDPSPEFTGAATPGSLVLVFARRTDQSAPTVLGAARAGADGIWRLNSIALAEGTYVISANASGAGGATGPLKALGSITVDTVAPRILFARLRPRAGRVLLALQDDRSGLDQSSVRATTHYIAARVRPIRSRSIPVTNIIMSGSGVPTMPEFATVVVNGGRRLPRSARLFLEARSGGIADVAGNALDGEFRGTWPSGEGTPGGNFAARLRLNRIRPLGPRPLSSGPLGVTESSITRGTTPAGPRTHLRSQR